jgi:biotin transport system substrate-specific component
MVGNALASYRIARKQAWQWRNELTWMEKLGLSLGMACLIGLLAQVRIPLPFTPVPVTGQTFGVLLAAIVLGQGWGAVSIAFYLAIGIAGVPWFNGMVGGVQALAGPTGGYLVGFMLAALFLGYFVNKFAKTRNYWVLLGLMLFADFVLIFGPGLLQLNLWLNLVSHNSINFTQLLSLGLVPFIIGDVVKVIAAATLGTALLPKEKD